jgi:hypothetical protein
MGDTTGASFSTVATPTGTWVSIAYGNGIYMAVAYDGNIATSTNTTTWNFINKFSGYVRSLVYTGDAWILACDLGLLFSYDNGNSWKNPNLGTGNYFNFISYGNGKIISGGVSNQNIISRRIVRKDLSTVTTDTVTIGREGTTTVVGSDTIGMGATSTLSLAGIIVMNKNLSTSFSYKQSTLAFDVNYTRYGVYAQGVFVVLEDANNNGRILTSMDGLNSTSYAGVGAVTARGLAYGMINGTGTFLATTYASPSVIFKSTNGTTWTQETPTNTLINIHSIVYGDGVFVACCQTTSNNLATTTDGKNWSNIQTRGTGGYAITFGAMTNGTNVFLVASGDGVYRSTNQGVTWNATAIAIPSGTWERPAFGNDVFLLVNRTTKAIIRSVDGGLNWSTPFVVNIVVSMPIFIENTWYIGSDYSNGLIVISNDNGNTWETKNIGISISLFLYNGSKLVGYYSNNQYLITIKKVSTDGTNITADTLTLGQEGTTTNLGAPLTIGYSPSQITNLNQIGYTTEDAVNGNTLYKEGGNLLASSVILPAGVWLVSYFFRFANYTRFTVINTYGYDSINGAGLPYGQYFSSATVLNGEQAGAYGTFVITSNGSLSYNIAITVTMPDTNPYFSAFSSGNLRSIVRRTRIA